MFGSYARGALTPADLDVIVVHDPLPLDVRRKLWEEIDGGPIERLQRSASRQSAMIRGPLRKPGEKIDILLVNKLDEIAHEDSTITHGDLILLWSETDRDFQSRLAAITPNASAGRAPRDHLFSLKRLDDTLDTMQTLVQMVRDQELTLTRIPLAMETCVLNDANLQCLHRWNEGRIVGKQSLKLLPFAMWWFQVHRQRFHSPNQLVMWSHAYTHRVHLGRPSMSWMLEIFKTQRKVKRQCLLPHVKGDGPNELLAFERGSCWSRKKKSKRYKSAGERREQREVVMQDGRVVDFTSLEAVATAKGCAADVRG